MTQVLDSYESALANKFDINPGGEGYDLASEEDISAQVFSMMVPMLMMAFLFSGCMAVAPESIAGEKERGTIATLLVTPLKRSHLALGKILSLSVIAILSGLSSFLGTMLSLPKLMGGGEMLKADVYGVKEYGMLLLVILSTTIMMVRACNSLCGFHYLSLCQKCKRGDRMGDPYYDCFHVVWRDVYGGEPLQDGASMVLNPAV